MGLDTPCQRADFRVSQRREPAIKSALNELLQHLGLRRDGTQEQRICASQHQQGRKVVDIEVAYDLALVLDVVAADRRRLAILVQYFD